MSTTSPSSPSDSIPVLLLKSPSPSPPSDPYTTHLTQPPPQSPKSPLPQNETTPPFQPSTYTTNFIPVLTHTLLPDALISLLQTHLQPHEKTNLIPPFPYGGIIFTSQRAVAAFTAALKSPPIQNRLSKLQELIRLDFYVVGPATERSLRSVRDNWMPACGIYGGEGAGSGEVLAGIIMGKEGKGEYTARVEGSGRKKPMLFLTGDKRRDVIPRMLMDPALGEEERVQVDEMVVYETAELEEFEFSFRRVLEQTSGASVRWLVVFSPTAGKGMLKALGWLDEAIGRVKKDLGKRRTFIACIGPTTTEYLDKEFGFKADVVAEKPSPPGVREGIEKFMNQQRIDAG